MNFSLRNHRRKWSCRGFMSVGAAMVTAAAGLLLALAEPAAARKYFPPLDLFADGPPRLRGNVHATRIPLPRPRPPEAAKIVTEKPVSGKPGTEPPTTNKTASDKPTDQATPAERPASACRLALTEEVAIAPSIPDISGPGGCGGEDLVRLEAVVLPDRRKVAVKPAAVLRCSMAAAIADWVRSDMAPLASQLGSTVSDLDNFDSFECRGRNRVAGALLSEHGRANALDVRAVGLANGQSIGLTDRTVPREVRERVLQSVCARFTTVLGPGSDWYHEDHIHLDLAQRRNGYRICQWNVWDPLPHVAPMLPAERPEDAPPREVAAQSETTKKDADAPAEKSAAESDEAKPARMPPTRKRR
ncbi:extensin family protein [Bradyrhizobium sp.]|uniref:extensin family protein n=1 Tax=Bradyrhizobium sp. TaxID=376 RepID=UPI00239C50AD|nr:extensin family protein [Bradyrhizobium sp.]MDE2379761.1 extensin family protein [Bradyrhizobium sp.]